MGTNFAPRVADLFLFCYERDFMMSLSAVKDFEIIDTFNSTSRYLDDVLNIDNNYFLTVWFLDLHLTVSDGLVSSKIYDNRDNFDFDVVNFSILREYCPS